MFRYNQGNGYLGTSKIEVSIANQEVIPTKPTNWTNGYRLYKFSFLNKQSCTIIINHETEIYLEANQGFEMDVYDRPIMSFVIK